MGREFELKYRCDEATLRAMAQHYGPLETITMQTTYYDTPDRSLRNRKWTLRRRLENGISVCTVKTPAVGGGRGEWEVNCGDILTAIPALVALGAPEALLSVAADGVREVCAARFTRLATLLSPEGCTLELALDEGVLLGGGKALPFAEVEAELKQGSEEAAIRFGETLARQWQLMPEHRSKVQRAMALADQP